MITEVAEQPLVDVKAKCKGDRLYLSLFRNTNIMAVKTPKQAVE
jgi:hypothetical protein